MNLFWNGFVNGFLASSWMPRGARRRLLRLAGLHLNTATINSGCFFGGKDIHIGHDTFLNYAVLIDNSAAVTIGDNCAIGHRAALITSSHQIGSSTMRAAASISTPIVIEDGVWIGAGATILGGVTVGRGAIIAAGAMVISDCMPDRVYAGVPAREIKTLPTDR